MNPSSFDGEGEDVFDTPYFTDEHKLEVAAALVRTITQVGGDPRKRKLTLIGELDSIFRSSGMSLKEAEDLIEDIVNPPCEHCGTRKGQVRKN